jgi:hypothetical protein
VASGFAGRSWNCVGRCRSTLMVLASARSGSINSQVCLATGTSRASVMAPPQYMHVDWGGRRISAPSVASGFGGNNDRNCDAPVR